MKDLNQFSGLLSGLVIDSHKEWNSKNINYINELGVVNLLIHMYKNTPMYIKARDATDTPQEVARIVGDTSYHLALLKAKLTGALNCNSQSLNSVNIIDFITSSYLNTLNNIGSWVSIQASNGTSLVEVAKIASGTTPLFHIAAGRLTGDLDCNRNSLSNLAYEVGLNLLGVADTERSTLSATYVSLKNIEVNRPGTWAIFFEMHRGTTVGTVYCRIYVNGTPYGAEFTTDSATYVEKSISVYAEENLDIELYAHIGTSNQCYVRYFRCRYKSFVPTLTVNVD